MDVQGDFVGSQPQELGYIKVKIGNDQEIARSEINSHSKN